MATTLAVVGALAGAYSANRQASAANAAGRAGQSGRTDQYNEQTPYHASLLEPDINNILWAQRHLVETGGVPQIDPRTGQLVYTSRDQVGLPGQAGGPQAQPTGANIGAGTAAATGSAARTGGAGAAGGSGAGGSFGGYTAAQLRADPALVGRLGANARARWEASGGGAGGSGVGSAAAGPNLSTPEGIFGEVARRGLDAGNSATQTQARNAIGNMLGAAGGGGPESTGFEGYNPVLDRLTQRLETDADSRSGYDLMRGFLGETGRAGGGTGNPNAYDGSAATQAGPVRVNYGALGTGAGGGAMSAENVEWINSNGASGTPPAAYGPGGSAGGGVPDTMAAQSFFGDQTRVMFDEPANDAELSDLISRMNADVEKGMFRDLAQLNAAASGSGRFGGSMWKGLSNDAREESISEMGENAARVRVGDRESRRSARHNALGMVNARDLGLLGANVQREGIAAGERASASANAGNAAALDAQMNLARRGQDLSAIGSMMDYDRSGMNTLAGVGDRLSGDRLGAVGLVPGLEGVGLSGISAALGAGGGLTDLRGQQVQRQIAGQQAGIARLGLNMDASRFNAGQAQGQVNDYMNLIRTIGGMGGNSHTSGTNVVAGAGGGVNTTAATLQGALGGGLAGYGAYQSYAGGGRY